jgi:signal transduction histidine kinase/ActR/RegA family two-component response regulator
MESPQPGADHTLSAPPPRARRASFSLGALSIRHKLPLFFMITSGVSLLVAAITFVAYDTLAFRKSMVDDLSVVADGVGINSTAALTFDVQSSGQEILAALKAYPHIVAACIFDRRGRVFSSYAREGEPEQCRAGSSLEPRHAFSGDRLTLYRPIVHDGEALGTVFIGSDMDALYARLQQYLLAGTVVIVCALALAFLLSSRLQRNISGPILTLARLETRVSRERDYSLRAVRETDDELGVLIDGFNEMLDQIQARDAELTVAVAAADRANRAKSAFLANVSHELRTPLNAVIGYSEMLEEEVVERGAQDLVPDLKRINTAGRHLLGLINDVLDLSKIEAGKMELSLETFDLRQVVSEIEAIIQPLIQKHANALTVRCADDVSAVHADPTRIRQILYNILSNAAKFTERGVITLDVSREAGEPDDWIVYRISDTGIGMTPEQQSRLFQAFSQAGASTASKYGGTGLGLAITRRLCQMMGGDIRVESQLGRGTTFTARHPLHVASQKPFAADADVSTPAAPQTMVDARPDAEDWAASHGTVLAIDDDQDSLDLVNRALAKEHIRVVTAASGEEGIALARTVRPQLITLDVHMPDRDGWSILSALKADADLSSIPVVLLTVDKDLPVGRIVSVAAYLTKPVDRDQLVAVVRQHLPVSSSTSAHARRYSV